jgi:hypothetical protein
VFERFTDDARRVVVLAQEEARLLDHDWIGTEHLLLAVIRQGGVVAEALEPFGLTLDRVRAEVELRTVPQGAHGGHIPFTDHAKNAMERSLREALKLGDRSITSAHLMLGVLEVEGCLGLQVVADVSDDVDEIKSWLKENRRVRNEPAEVEGPTVTVGMERTRPMRLLQSQPGRCAFCDRDLWEVEASVAGPGVAICSDCVDGAARVLRAAAEAGTPTPDPLPLPPRVFGDQPAGDDAEAVVAALRGAITTDLTPEERIASMEDGATLLPLIEAAGARYAGRVQLVIGAVRFRTDDHAQVRYEIVLHGGMRVPFEGDVVRRRGRWIVTRDTIVRLLGRSGTHPPPPPPGP